MITLALGVYAVQPLAQPLTPPASTTPLQVLAGPDADADWVRSFEPHPDGFDADVRLLTRGTIQFGDLFLLRSADDLSHAVRIVADPLPDPGITQWRYVVAEAATGVEVVSFDLAGGATESPPFVVLPDAPGGGPRYVGTLVASVDGLLADFEVRWRLEAIA